MEEFLIEKVREHEVLYNIKSCNYRDQDKRHEAWEEIGRDLKIEAETAKATWDRLRRCFLNARNRRRCKNSVQAVKKIPPWKYEHQMSFLLPFMENRKTQSNVEKGATESDSRYDESQDYEKVENEASEDLQMLHTDPQDVSLDNNTEISDRLVIIKRKKRKNKPVQELVQVMEENSSMGKKTKHKKKRDKGMDETDMFFLSMSKMTKSLPPIEQAKIKLALSTVVLKAQIKFHERQENFTPRQSFITSPSSSESTTASYSVYSSETEAQRNCTSLLNYQ